MKKIISSTKVVTSVKALLIHKGKFLLLKEELRKGQVWDLPGGKIEYGESPEIALKREVKEEIGIDIQVLQPVGVWYFYSQHNKDQVICHTYLCTPKEEAFIIDTTKNPADEHFTKLQWCTLTELIDNKSLYITDSFHALLVQLQKDKSL